MQVLPDLHGLDNQLRSPEPLPFRYLCRRFGNARRPAWRCQRALLPLLRQLEHAVIANRLHTLRYFHRAPIAANEPRLNGAFSFRSNEGV
ncbi:hypothetical protein RHE_PE00165 (plasmid) [Rhizobium etli CFN 42]|uniref:Uncharacterized protein n=2 Tax=Rhizobium etli TaxID=29449 RepID=Q2K0F8_RHIEC|nr:hypothetical protein RHE_PE00165 [Rhizobium etli CFN 42]ARQ12811.1 hypothetical protein NXC12_PC00171 [Rhizobium etli]